MQALLAKLWGYIKALLYNKYALLIIAAAFFLAFIYNAGYIKGKSNVKIIKDTVYMHDTMAITDTAYTPARVDTIIDSVLSVTGQYVAYYGEYYMHRGGYVHTWYIPSRELFKWDVREPSPMLITQTKTVSVRVPTIDYKACAISGVIGFIGGTLTILLLQK